MELILNELSKEPLASNQYTANERMEQVATTVNEAKKQGFQKIRSDDFAYEIELSNEYTLNDWLNNKNVSEIQRNFLYGMITPPFIKDGDEQEDKYIENSFYFENEAYNYPKTECPGLAAAYLYNTLSLSFPTSAIWCNTTLSITIEKDDNAKNEQVHNIFSEASLKETEIATFIESITKLELLETDIPPNNKNIHLADHHGKKELKSLCNRIKHSPYVLEMRSTNWGGSNFIRSTSPDGVIELVLLRYDMRYALSVQTTGRNLRETQAIAEILEERYS
ncbi:MAG: hypothetical protein AB8E82_06940 [Aureispira sp.]